MDWALLMAGALQAGREPWRQEWWALLGSPEMRVTELHTITVSLVYYSSTADILVFNCVLLNRKKDELTVE